mgnify:CR=1 FL=1
MHCFECHRIGFKNLGERGRSDHAHHRSGVSFGLAATIGSLDWNASQYVQLAGVLGSGGALGYGIYDIMSSPEGEATAKWNATAVPMYGGGAVVLSGKF